MEEKPDRQQVIADELMRLIYLKSQLSLFIYECDNLSHPEIRAMVKEADVYLNRAVDAKRDQAA